MEEGEEAVKYIWKGAIPLQIHLHESDITTLPPPPPFLILGPRIAYLPLLIPTIKAHFASTLPPGTDNVWFDYKGLPLKWYIPTGVLFDLLCAEPERPWNLTVHFRGSPGEVLAPCEGEDSVKWSYINSLKEAAYIINGNCKNVMNLSQADQLDLWQSLLRGNLEGYIKISSRLKLGPIGGEDSPKQSQLPTLDEPESAGSSRPCRIPVRLYVRRIGEELQFLEDSQAVDNWDQILYINRPLEIQKHEVGSLTLEQAIKLLLPEIFEADMEIEMQESETVATEMEPTYLPKEKEKSKRVWIRVQGIEPDMEIPFVWLVNCLKHPEFYLHICVFVGSSKNPK